MVKKTKKNTKKQTSTVETLNEIANKLIELIGTKAEVEVAEDKENDSFVVKIKTDTDSGLLIGGHGKTLMSIQLVLGLMLRQRMGEWKRVVVDVADWREKEEERLNDLAAQATKRALSTGEPQYLYNLNASQRRMVHVFLAEDKSVTTESQGEGEERFLIISPAK